MRVIVALFKNYYIFFLISIIFCSEDKINNIINFSSGDFSVINNSEFQLNFGVQPNNLVHYNYFFSIDKLISNNLFFSTKILKYQDKNSEIFIQNIISYSSDNSPFNYSFSFNYLTDNNRIDRWNNVGLFLDRNIKSRIILFSGIYFDFTSFDNESWKTINYYFSSKFKLSNYTSLSTSLIYNPDYALFNQSIKFSIKL